MTETNVLITYDPRNGGIFVGASYDDPDYAIEMANRVNRSRDGSLNGPVTFVKAIPHYTREETDADAGQQA